MFQLFQKSFHFAAQELKERCWFWYKSFMVLCVKLFCVTMVLMGIPFFSVMLALGAGPYIPQNFVIAWTIVLWSLVAGIVGFCLYHLITKVVQIMADWLVMTLNASYDQSSQKLVTTRLIASFSWILLMLSIPVSVLTFGKHLIVIQTGSKILGALVYLIMSILMAIRLHFAYFIAFENSTNAESSFQIALASIKQSFRLTRGKFWQLLFIFLFIQIYSIVFTMTQAFDATEKTFGFLSAVVLVLSLLATPLFTLMFARSYVLLSEEKN
jgi:hypothetical protein